jgi:hypothetical protein
MNYIKQLKGFRIRRMIEPINTNSICLYFILLEYNNELDFIKWFTAPNSTLQGLTGLHIKTLQRARNELVQKGYINYKKGTGNKAGLYNIVDLTADFDQQTVQQDAQQMSNKLSDSQSRNVSTLYKLNQTKQNNKKKNIKKKKIDVEEVLEKMIDDYTVDHELKKTLLDFVSMRKEIKKPLTERALKAALDKLNQLAFGDAEKLEIVNNSLIHSWQSFYAPNKNNMKNGGDSHASGRRDSEVSPGWGIESTKL